MDVAVAARAGRPGWLNRRTVLGGLLLTVSLAGGHSILERADATTPMWVAARDLAGGSVLTDDALRLEEVHFPARLAASYLEQGQRLEGRVLTRPVAAGELIPSNWVSESPPSQGRSVTIPVDPEHAVGGALTPGDLVDVFATFDPGDVRARTVSLVREVEVIDVVAAGGLVMGQEAVVGVTVSVDPDEAQRIAFATRTAEIDVVRIEDPSARGSGSTITARDF